MKPSVPPQLGRTVSELVGSVLRKPTLLGEPVTILRDPSTETVLSIKPSFLSQLGRRVSELVGSVFRPTVHVSQEFAAAWFDLIYFAHQFTVLDRTGMPQYVAIFTDEGPAHVSLPVLVQVPDLHNVKQSYERALEGLRKSGLPLESVTKSRAEEIFSDRLSEFLAVQSSQPSGTDDLTTVHSKRKGDTILYAKGYFLSTTTAFGISTPAKNHLSAGRYGFGILDLGMPRFQGVLWSCPTTVNLNLP